MCGIAGFYGHGDIGDLDRMVNALAHRGPDGEGMWSNGSTVFIGHKRLAIVDLESGKQPMTTTDGELVVTFNGEIYNHSQLRAQLEALGHQFQSHHSDTEVLLHGYRQWGAGLVERLNGMWAFAIFDSKKQLFFLSRDRFGQKPLFYARRHDFFAFASELTSLTSHQFLAPSISDLSVQKYFAYGYIPAPSTIFERFYKLPAGTSLTYSISGGGLRTTKYWDYMIEPFEKVPRNAEREWADELQMLLRRSVNRRLMADVELGVFLSGGLDSSIITSLASQESNRTVRSFTLGFEEPSFDETAPAESVARAIGTWHHSETLSLERNREHLKEVVGNLDEPIGDSSLLPTWLLSRMTSRHVKVALSGDGGDELFAGYDPFAALAPARAYELLVPDQLHAVFTRLADHIPVSHKNMSFDFKVKRTLSGLDHPPSLWGPVWMAPLPPALLNELFPFKVDIEEVFSEALETWEACAAESPVDRLTQFYVKLYLQDDILVKTDRASMMHGLEVRAPFLDLDVVNLARRIPWQYRYRHRQRKAILKTAAENLVPKAVAKRTKKGFGAPVGRWFKEQKLDLAVPEGSSLFQGDFVERCQDLHRRGATDYRLFLWSFWVLQHFSNSSLTAPVER